MDPLFGKEGLGRLSNILFISKSPFIPLFQSGRQE
jgi:hypothetical protein